MNSFAQRQKDVKEQAAKDAIYEATIAVLLEHGIDGLKMQKIADKAGIASGTVYNYFDNKEQLLYYIDERVRETIISIMQKIADAPGRADKKMNALLKELLEFGDRHHIVFDLAEKVGIHGQIPKMEKAAYFGRCLKCIQNILDEGIEQKIYKKTNTEKAARFILFAIIGIMRANLFLDEFDSKKYCRELMDVIKNHFGSAKI